MKLRQGAKGGAWAVSLLLVGLLAERAGIIGKASAAEVCRFSGTTNYDGHVDVMTHVLTDRGATRVDVSVTFESVTMFWFHIHYMVEEISNWRAGKLESVAVNTRYLFGGHVVRQQWDDFRRDREGLQAYRVQAKTLADFRARHPGFVQHWDPADFGQPWLADYHSAAAERRADLDLKGSPLPSTLRSPLALAFYWVRWLPPEGQDVPVFLPGFKRERVVDLPITGAVSGDDTVWRAPVRYPALSDHPVSEATAWVSADHHLQRLAFELHQPRGSAHGQISQLGCEGGAAAPGRQR